MAEVTYFERLDVPECLRLLGGGGVGRVVWQGADGLTVLPVNYRLINGAVVSTPVPHPRWRGSLNPRRWLSR